MRRTLARIERLERTLAERTSTPVNPHFVKRPITDEFMAEVERIYWELTADARARNPNYDEELARYMEGLPEFEVNPSE
jgi:hypothetical protein